MRNVTLGLTLTLALAAPLAAQQQPAADGGPTEAQLASAEAEVPRLVEIFQLKPGMSVADVGAGFGAWTIGFAEAVGPTGRVYSSDVGEQQLASLRQTKTRRAPDKCHRGGRRRAVHQPAGRVLRCDPGPRRVPSPDGAGRHDE